ncbi:MAG: DUF4290 domain-containing protein [Muribaculaceae bacterium]|nr:DUF4290 domain-containing protein [Muribaculaceae bacterium]
MLTYNTRQKQLVLPEYGRNIQRMVDHCLTIADRGERTQCAYAIVKAMGCLFPELKQGENEHKLWDHLMIMSGFSLDIDFPCEVVGREELQSAPAAVPYMQSPMRYRHYGRLTQAMIAKAVEMPAGDERDELVLLLANQMKKQMLAVNPDGVDDGRIFRDLADMTRGEIRLDPAAVSLRQYKAAPQPAKGKKKKKR